jgi:hypothetical protein
MEFEFCEECNTPLMDSTYPPMERCPVCPLRRRITALEQQLADKQTVIDVLKIGEEKLQQQLADFKRAGFPYLSVGETWEKDVTPERSRYEYELMQEESQKRIKEINSLTHQLAAKSRECKELTEQLKKQYCAQCDCHLDPQEPLPCHCECHGGKYESAR